MCVKVLSVKVLSVKVLSVKVLIVKVLSVKVLSVFMKITCGFNVQCKENNGANTAEI